MNVVPTTKTRHVARLMLATTLRNTGPDAVLRHLSQIERDQVPALVGLLLTNTKVTMKPGRKPMPDVFSEHERRRAYAAYKRGERSDWAVTGFREYQRHQQRKMRIRRGGGAA